MPEAYQCELMDGPVVLASGHSEASPGATSVDWQTVEVTINLVQSWLQLCAELYYIESLSSPMSPFLGNKDGVFTLTSATVISDQPGECLASPCESWTKISFSCAMLILLQADCSRFLIFKCMTLCCDRCLPTLKSGNTSTKTRLPNRHFQLVQVLSQYGERFILGAYEYAVEVILS
ncbi:hypothetical protein E2C01_056995 [Portunus trituberculatus]|uniref:Uncharacterized protein n=1 Tax=Portunus trituberculatus TaxID=210409 RepID=A0A5B7GZV6_PORTR|nr:hypothetical protein [Portunus trituberculatus]